MAPTQIGEHWVGESHDDLQMVLQLFSEEGDKPVDRFNDVVCECGHDSFRVSIDEEAKCAVRTCIECDESHFITQNEKSLEVAELNQCDCFCGEQAFQFSAAMTLLSNRHHIDWLYLGLRCTACGVMGCYADWQCEPEEYSDFSQTL